MSNSAPAAPRGNVVVEAGAGTGKTSLLIRVFLERVLGAPGLEPVPVERIVALTFTKKAAGEIKERLFKALAEKASLSGTSRERERARAALQDADKAAIDTIHGFASYLLRLYPLESELSPDFVIDEGALIEEAFEEEWLHWLDVELGESAPRRAPWVALLRRAELEQIKELARAAVSEKLPEESLARPAEALLRAAREREESAALESSARDEAAMQSALELLAPFRRALRSKLAEKGLVSFDGLLMRARNLLRDHPGVREDLKGRYDAFLVDEFQDTDPLQGEILFFLAEEKGAASRERGGVRDWERLRLGGGRLFVVGDPKQSIYRFRGADIAAYQRFTRRVIEQGGSPLDLELNYRSPAALLNVVNGVFAALMLEKPGLQAPYKALRPGSSVTPAVPKPGSSFKILDPGFRRDDAPVEIAAAEAAKAPEGLRLQAEFAASWIARHCGPGKKRRYKDAAVLLRSATALPEFCQALRDAGVPYVSDGEKSFFAAPEAGDLINLIRALRDPSDQSALAGILRSPLVCLPDDELARLAREGGLDYLKDPAPAALKSGREAVLCLFNALRRVHALGGRAPLGELLNLLFESLSVRELLSSAYGGQQTAANLSKLLRMAEDFTSDPAKGPDEFVSFLAQSRKEGRAEGESPLADERFDAVRLLTIHKAKGLEFPVVFLANLAAKAAPPASGPSSLYDWETGTAGFRIKGKGSGPISDIAMTYLSSREKAREDEERIRLLYVAMTRAKEKLFMLGRTKLSPGSLASLLKKAGAWPEPESEPSSLNIGGERVPVKILREGENFLKGLERPERDAASPPFPEPEEFARVWRARGERRLAAAAKSAISPSREAEFVDADASLPGLDREPAAPAPQREPAPEAGEPALLGRLCHKVLEGWDFKKPAAPEELSAALDRAARELSAAEPGEGWSQARAAALELLSAFLAGPWAQSMSRARVLGRETPFSYARDGALVNGVIDLIYEDPQGLLVVADYKSDRASSPAEWERLRKKYLKQGTFYLEAVEKSLGRKPARFEVVFLRAS